MLFYAQYEDISRSSSHRGGEKTFERIREPGAEAAG